MALDSTCEHPSVRKLHETLDDIERKTIPSVRLSQRAHSERTVARARRKKLERRASQILPDSGINPDDTGEYYIEPALQR